jgi:hypothetical protein
LAQFQRQYGALTRSRLERAFVCHIGIIAEQSEEDGRRLVLRDHAHTDFTGRDCTFRPALWSLLVDAGWEVTPAATIRDPIESYISLVANGWHNNLDFDQYCWTWLKFVDAYAGVPTFRYEDFCDDPDTVLKGLCEALEIEYVADYASRIAERSFTGDSGRSGCQIEPREAKPVDQALIVEARSSKAYARILETWPVYSRPFEELQRNCSSG